MRFRHNRPGEARRYGTSSGAEPPDAPHRRSPPRRRMSAAISAVRTPKLAVVVDDRQRRKFTVGQRLGRLFRLDQWANRERIAGHQFRDRLVGLGKHQVLEFQQSDQPLGGVGYIDVCVGRARTFALWARTVVSASAAVTVSVTTKTSGRICAETDFGGQRKILLSASACSAPIWASNDSRVACPTFRSTSAPWSGSSARASRPPGQRRRLSHSGRQIGIDGTEQFRSGLGVQ